MEEGMPSRTALGAAGHRAAHQVLDSASIFRDPLALRILGGDAGSEVLAAWADPRWRGLRLFIAARARFAEDCLAAAVSRGLRQLVVLGAGLDTYAYRAEPVAGMRIFEVDHPATQGWKRRRLEDAGIRLPRGLTFAPVDFEREDLGRGLGAAGFDPGSEAFFTWLGVVPYLSQEAVFSTLAYIGGLPGGSHVVFDYGNPPGDGDALHAAARRRLARRVASLGEELRSEFESRELHSRLGALGFRSLEDLGPPAIAERYFPEAVARMPERGGHIIRASTEATA
jgi:methyltransferase (TIGR00027 family)